MASTPTQHQTTLHQLFWHCLWAGQLRHAVAFIAAAFIVAATNCVRSRQPRNDVDTPPPPGATPGPMLLPHLVGGHIALQDAVGAAFGHAINAHHVLRLGRPHHHAVHPRRSRHRHDGTAFMHDTIITPLRSVPYQVRTLCHMRDDTLPYPAGYLILIYICTTTISLYNYFYPPI
ncbi:hypothetical protein BJY52DRAFT_452338 [Lactarius psammicola]|nr:hypothetical protein BJY52DRAFT_452338 [Lactarius psammicola]